MSTNNILDALDREDRTALQIAHRQLEHPSLAARITHVVGTPIEIALHLLPKDWYDRLHAGVEQAIAKALDVAIATLHSDNHTPLHPGSSHPIAHDYFYKWLCAGAGALGGLFGLAALPVELPVTTTIMLRSIADIARSYGERLDSPDTRLACMEVFALGGRSEEDDAANIGYYGVRLALALSVANAGRHVIEKGVIETGGPTLIKLITAISSRFGVVVSERAAVQLIPVLGAAGAALLNTIFLQHFQETARGHFTIRRLEQKYGVELIETAYESLAD